jgi:hypothetical protein
MGSKGSQTTNTSQNQTYVPTGAGYLTNALNSATGLFGQGTPTIPTAPVAGLTGQQQQAFGLAGNTGIQNPFISAAQNLFSPSGINQFYNPAVNSVTAQMQNIFGQQNQQNTANLVQSAGGVGADRIAVGQGNLANQQALAAGQTYSGLWNNAAQQAQSAAYGTAGLGQQAQAANTADISNLLGTGGLQQQLSQAQLNAPYQQQLAQLALPYQLQQQYSQNIGALAPALGGTTFGTGTTNTSYDPSLLSQITGLGALGLGAFGKGSGGAVPSFDDGGAVGAGQPLPITPDIAARFQRRLQSADDDEALARVVRDAARYGVDWSHMLGKADGGPIDVSSGLFSGAKLLHLPDASLSPARATVPQLNLNMQQPNLAGQQNQGMQGMAALGKAINNSSFGDALSDFSQDLFSARGGAIFGNPFRRQHFDDGGSASDGDGGDGSAPSGGGDNASASDANAPSGSFGPDADAAAAAAMATGLASGLSPDDATLGFSPSEMTSDMQDAGHVGDASPATGLGGIAGFGPDAVSGPAGIGLGYGTAAAGLGMGNMTGFGPAAVSGPIGDPSGAFGVNDPAAMGFAQSTANSLDENTPNGVVGVTGMVNAALAALANQQGKSQDQVGPSSMANLANIAGINLGQSQGFPTSPNVTANIDAAMSSLQGMQSNPNAELGNFAANLSPDAAVSAVSPSIAPSLSSPGLSDVGTPSLGTIADLGTALAALGYGGGYGYTPRGYRNPFARHYQDGGDVSFDDRFNSAGDGSNIEGIDALRRAMQLQNPQGAGYASDADRAAGLDMLRSQMAPAGDQPIRLDPQATQAWRDSTPLPTADATDDTAPPDPTDHSASAVLTRAANGQQPGAVQAPPQAAPPTAGGKGSGTGLFGPQGYFHNLTHDPARMALIMGGLSAFTPAGFSGGFGRGLQMGLTSEQAAKKLEQEADKSMTDYQQAMVDIAKGKAAQEGESVISDEDAKFYGAQRALGAPVPNFGYGKAGAASRAKIAQATRQYAADHNLTPEDMVANQIDYAANRAGATTAARASANIDRTVIEAHKTFPLAEQASAAVPRGQWVPINRLLQMGQSATSDPKLGAFMVANQGAIIAYSQAMARGGQNSVFAQQHAENLLNTATSHEAYVARLRQMDKEMDAAQAAPREVRANIRGQITGRAPPTATAPSGAVDWRTYFGAH